MNATRLTILPGLPAADRRRVGPHAYRRVGGKLLISDESGRLAVLSEDEYRRFLAGLDPEDELGGRLSRAGFLRHSFDFDASAAALLESAVLRWRGPDRHLILLERGGRAMSLETASAAADFAFSAPGPVTLELCCVDAAAAWPRVWFLVQYARRRAEWGGRPLFLLLRAESGVDGERAEFLRAHAVTRRALVTAEGAPPRELPFPAQSVLLRIAPGAREPRAWAKWLGARGAESVLLIPERLKDAADALRFLLFYAECLDFLAGGADGLPWRDELALAFLARRSWALPGMDLLGELAYAPEGGVFSSAAGLEADAELFKFGELGRLRWSDLKDSPLARAMLSAAVPDNQPLCGQCAYRGFCSLPPSQNYARQGTVWGRTPESPLCVLNMGVLDLIFSRLFEGRLDALLAHWGVPFVR